MNLLRFIPGAARWLPLWLYSLFLRWCIRGDEDYLIACSADGLTDSLSLREFRLRLCEARIKLIDVQAAMQRALGKGPGLPARPETNHQVNVESGAAEVGGPNYRAGSC